MIIGLIGVAGSGKTTAANIIAEHFNPCLTVSFAGKLKRTCSKVFNVPLNDFEDRKAKEDLHEDRYILLSDIVNIFSEFGVDAHDTKLLQMAGTRYNSNRELLQIVGTDILRAHDPDIHTKTIYPIDSMVLLVPDVRFANEAKYLDDHRAYLVYIQNSSAESKVTDSSHKSEREILEDTRKYATHVIGNDGKDMEKFREKIGEFCFDVLQIKNT